MPGQRALAALAASGLALLTLLGTQSGPPEVGVDDLSRLDGGVIVKVRGTVVDAWTSDAGALSLVLADLDSKATVKVVCAQGTPGPRTEFHVGDVVLATGQLELTGGRPVIWVGQGKLELVTPSRDSLTLEDLGDSWELLVGDRFEVAGVLVISYPEERVRLVSPESQASILVLIRQTDYSRFLDRLVVVDALLRLDSNSMELVLDAYSISLAP